jgi:hypothetical protein
MNSDSPLNVIKGRAYQRPATLSVHEDKLIWRAARGQLHPRPEQYEIPLEDMNLCTLHYRTWTAVSIVGLVMVGLAVLWQVYGSISLPAAAAIGFAGALGIVLRRVFPETWLVMGTSGMIYRLRENSRSVGRCEDLVRRFQGDRPELAGVNPENVLPYLGRQVRILFASKQSLREEFRLTVRQGEPAPDDEERFIGARKRMAVWMVLWFFVLPLGGALVVQPFLPSQPGIWLAVRVGLWFFLFLSVCMFVQGLLFKKASKWILGID